MKTLELPNKRQNAEVKDFYKLSLEDRRKKMIALLGSIDESPTLTEDRREILLQMRGRE